MKPDFPRRKVFLRSALGAALAVLCGLLLRVMPVGDPWVNASYDYLFRFMSSTATNRVVLIQLDNEAYDYFHQARGQPWDRALHAQLLNRLADDGCSLVVFDAFFRQPRDPVKDEALAAAMRRQRVVLMAEQAQVTHPEWEGARPIPPAEIFLKAATNWGVAWVAPDSDFVVRRHWPFPSPGPYPSLPWTVARLVGARVDDTPRERWLRYYGERAPWTKISYRFAMTEPPKGFFRDAIVFIGSSPKTSMPGDANDYDEFSNPYTRWTNESTGGVEILITSFLNLLNGDWLERSPGWLEGLILMICGIASGGFLCRLRPLRATAVSALAMAGISVAAICWSHFGNQWFPWLIVVGAQLPCALAWALVTKVREAAEMKTVVLPPTQSAPSEPTLAIPGYELFPRPFGEGAYGKVFLARDDSKRWQALKVVYLSKFDKNVDPYDREFKGVNFYKPISEQHPGLLKVNYVSPKMDGYFYYAMELGDGVEPGWEDNPASYQPRDLANVRQHLPGKRLPTMECIQIGVILCDALEFLHQRGFTHRDIKPSNVIFVNGQPRLADVGLIAEIRPDQERTLVGTPGYMPPAPEIPGTPQADIYSLGMVLYVVSTGGSAAVYPEISSTLAASRTPAEFHALNAVILKACKVDPEQRYSSAADMRQALQDAQRKLERDGFGKISEKK